MCIRDRGVRVGRGRPGRVLLGFRPALEPPRPGAYAAPGRGDVGELLAPRVRTGPGAGPLRPGLRFAVPAGLGPGGRRGGGAVGRGRGDDGGGERGARRGRAVARGGVPGGARTEGRAGGVTRLGAGHPQVPLAVRGGRQTRRRGARGEAEGGLAEPQQRAGDEADRALAHLDPVQRGAVRRAEVGDRDPAVVGDRDRAVQPRDVRVVEGDVRVGGAADPDLPAVQQVDPSRVRSGHHVELGRDGVVRRLLVAGHLEREDRAVHQGRLAQRDPVPVQPLPPGVEHHGPTALGALGARHGGRQLRGDGGQCRPGGGGDEHVAGARRGLAAARREDGQPDLHRRQRSLLREGARQGKRPVIPPTRHGHVVRTGRDGPGDSASADPCSRHPRTCH